MPSSKHRWLLKDDWLPVDELMEAMSKALVTAELVGVAGKLAIAQQTFWIPSLRDRDVTE